MSYIRKTVVTAVLFLLSGCLYTNTTVPLDTNVSQTTIGPKIGVSSVHSVLWLVAWGDGGVDAAAKNGGLKKIDQLDLRTFEVFFGAYTRIDTIAYGD